MANAALALSNVVTSLVQNNFLVTASAALADANANVYFQGQGITLSLAGLVPTSGKAPTFVEVVSSNVAGVSAYGYKWHNDSNANIANCSVQVFTNGNLATEVTGNAALPTAVKNDVLTIFAVLPR
jgi:hypothetical protein